MANTELTIVEQTPADVIIKGKDAAQELTRIVSSRDKRLVLGGKQYLFFEDWQTIGKFYGVTAKIIGTEELKIGDKLIGFLASAVAIVRNEEISGADAECTYDEQNWQGKPRFQLRSMAQTRACAKALRNCLGWVAVLAGYEPTPAEEMADTHKGHWCSIHNCTFFKKGRMKGWAHKVEDTDEWCNEIEETKNETPEDKAGIMGEILTDETPPATALELMNWAFAHGKEFGPSWVRKEAGIKPLEVITNEKASEAYKLLKERMKW